MNKGIQNLIKEGFQKFSQVTKNSLICLFTMIVVMFFAESITIEANASEGIGSYICKPTNVKYFGYDQYKGEDFEDTGGNTTNNPPRYIYKNSSLNTSKYVIAENAIYDNGTYYDLLIYPWQTNGKPAMFFYRQTNGSISWVNLQAGFYMYHQGPGMHVKIYVTEHGNINKKVNWKGMMGGSDLDGSEYWVFPNTYTASHIGGNISVTRVNGGTKYMGKTGADGQYQEFVTNAFLGLIEIPTTGAEIEYGANYDWNYKSSFAYDQYREYIETNSYVIQFNANGGTGSVPSFVLKFGTNGNTVMGKFDSTVPTMTGYVFRGWSASTSFSNKRVAYSESKGGASTKYGGESSKASIPDSTWTYNQYCENTGGSTQKNILTLYAQWQPITYTVKYNGNGNTGGSTASSTHTYNSSKTLTPNGFTKAGYTFEGWATSSNGNVVYTDKQSVKNLTTTNGAVITLYAKWKANPYPYEIHYYFQNVNGKGYTENTDIIATVKATAYMDNYVTVPLPSATAYGYKYSSMTIASGGRLSDGKIRINFEEPANVAKKNVVSVYYNWDDGNNTGGGDSAKNLGLVTFDTNKLNWHLDPGANISASWKWTPTSTTNSSADGFESPENKQGYFVQRLYAVEGSNVTSGYGAFISRGQSEIQLKSIADKYKGNGGGNTKTWGGDFPTVTATGCTFLGWNSKADGSGTWYSANGSGNKSGSDKNNTAVLVMDSTNKKYGQTVTLYAIWADNATVKASITYNQGVVNNVTGVAGTAANLEPLFESKTSTVVSESGSIVTLPWAKDAQVNIIGQDKATGNYLFYSKLIGADNSHKNQDAGTTTIFAAGLGEDSGTVNALSNSIKRDSDANKNKNTSGAYTQNEGTYHLDYDIQGTYAVSVRNESREYEEAIKTGVIQGDPAYKHLNNVFKIKIDNTAPVITSWRVTQDRLENYKSSEMNDVIGEGLYTTFKISFSDAHNSAKGPYLNQRDTSGVQGIYIRVWDKNDTSSVKVYSVPLERVTNKTLTDNEDAAIFSGTVTYPINLYSEFPNASSIIYEAYVVDNAGNVTEKIGSVALDSDKPLPDPDEGPEEPDDPSDPTPSPSPDYPSGTLTNFSIKTVIYNDSDEEFNVEDFVTYGAVSDDVGAFFQTGDIGHVDVWTIGYVTSVSPDFGAGAGDSMAEEAIDEITSGRLPAKYNMGLDSMGDYKRVWNYSQAEVLKPKYISYYDEDLHQMVIVYRDAAVKANYSSKAYTAKEQQTYNKLVIHDGIPYAAYYTTKADDIADDTKAWLSSGTKVRIPPYYQMKYPYSKSEKTHADGTTAYKTETHIYKATAYKNGDTADASWIYMIYDMGFNDLHFRVIHENGVADSGSYSESVR